MQIIAESVVAAVGYGLGVFVVSLIPILAAGSIGRHDE